MKCARFTDGILLGKGASLSERVNFFYRDHLGSVRAVTDGAGRLKEQNDYYPFGARHIRSDYASSDNLFRFNGKEQQVRGNVGYLDYGARMYDAAVGRWMVQDPLSEKYYGLSTYGYCWDNPVNAIDPDGKDGIYIAFPRYKADGYPFTGHAGVLLIDNKTGYTKYYEYGRYDGVKEGKVRSYSVPNVIIKDGKPTVKSLDKVLSRISKTSGKGQVLEGAYIESDNFDIMNNYAKGKLAENSDKNKTPYNIFKNNCGTFADDVIKQDKSVDAPAIFDPRPLSIIDEYQNNFTSVSYDPKKGVTIKYDSHTVLYDNQKHQAEIKQSWWQKLWYGRNK